MLIKIVDIDKTYVLSPLQTFFQSLNFKKIFMICIWLCIHYKQTSIIPDNLQTLRKKT
jgi:hypothetical protein